MNCIVCEEVTTEFRYCKEHHRYRNGSKELTSVTRVISSVLPSDFSGIPPETLENARERGCQTDELFCGYITGKLEIVPTGTQLAALEFFYKLTEWWHSENRGKADAQVLVTDSDIAGQFDIWCDGILYDLKCVYTLRPEYDIQLAAYRELALLQGYAIHAMRIIHITERFRKPKLIPVDMVKAGEDWLTVRRAWELQRRLKKAS